MMNNSEEATSSSRFVKKTHRRLDRVHPQEFDSILWHVYSNDEETETPLDTANTPVDRKRKTHRRSRPIGSFQELFHTPEYSTPSTESRHDSPLRQLRSRSPYSQQVVPSPPPSLYAQDSRPLHRRSRLVRFDSTASPKYRPRCINLSPHIDTATNADKIDSLDLPLLDHLPLENNPKCQASRYIPGPSDMLTEESE